MSPPEAAPPEPPTVDRERLLAFLRQELPRAEALELSALRAASGGVSREHFFLELAWSEGAARRERSAVLIRDGDRPGQTDRGAEFRLLRLLRDTSIPAPEAYWCDTTGRWLDRPFIVMERVRGAVTPPFQVPYPERPELRRRLTERFVDVLGDLHRLDWRARGVDFLEVPSCATGDLAATAARLLRDAVKGSGLVAPSPTIERGLAWCIEHAPGTERWTICHGDYKPDNVLHADGELLAIIDWERARIGDPLADLGYICVPHLRVGSRVCGLAEQEAVVRRYEQRTGFAVDPQALRFWQLHMLLQTVLYFSALRADATRTGSPLAAQAQPLLNHLVGLVEATLG